MKKQLFFILIISILFSIHPFAAFATSELPVEGDWYFIVSALDENKVLDVQNASTNDSANIQLYEFNGSGAQLFKFTYDNGYYSITNKNSGKVVDIQGGGTKSGTNVQQYRANGTDAQKWIISDAGNGYCSIQAKCGLFIDVSGGNTSNKTNIQVYSGNDTLSQSFKLVPYVNYTYKTVTLDCSSLDAWKTSLAAAGRTALPGSIVAQEVLSYKTAKIEVPITGPQQPNHTNYTTVELKLPYEVEYKLHTHTLNSGYGRNWYYTQNGIQLVETCNCGYRHESLFWEIPDLTETSLTQTTQSVISGLPRPQVLKWN